MSPGLSPASAIALSAASACSMICDMPRRTPSSVVSAAPTTATDLGFISGPRRPEERQSDVVALLREADLERHVEHQRLRRLRHLDEVGHHARPLLELDDGDGV